MKLVTGRLEWLTQLEYEVFVAEANINLATIGNQDIMNNGIKKASKTIPHNNSMPNI